MKPLSPEQQVLAASRDAKRAVDYWVSYYRSRLPWLYDEITSGAWLGAIRAAGSWDPSRGAKFSTHAYTCVQRHIINALREAQPKGFRSKERCKKTGPAPKIERINLSVRDARWDPAEGTRTELEILHLTSQLDARSRRIVTQYYTTPKTLQQIADEIDISIAHASGILKQALRTMRRALENEVTTGRTATSKECA